MRIIEVITEHHRLKELAAIARDQGATDVWPGPQDDENRRSLRILVTPKTRQPVLDGLQAAMGDQGRILLLPVDASLPREEDEEEILSGGASREELYDQIDRGARLDRDYMGLVFLSAIVASIGLVEDNVAIVVGAMVIAPLLGPNLGLALGTSLGDRDLIVRSLKTNAAGLSVATGIGIAFGLFWGLDYESKELMTRTVVGLDSIMLALASGAAAVLSLTNGLPTALVGVMVAVALMPPVATMGMMLGAGRWDLALTAGLLLAVNIVCVNLSAKLVFLLKGVKPRTWLEKRQAFQSMRVYILFWVVALVVLAGAIMLDNLSG